MFHSRIVFLAGLFAVLLLASLLIAWPEIRGLCSACAPVSVKNIRSTNFVHVRQAAELETIFGEEFRGTTFPSRVPRVYVRSMPHDMTEIEDTERRKQLFLRIVVPQVLRLNEAILADRKRVLQIAQSGNTPSDADRAWLASIAQRYGTTSTDPRTLLARLDIVPPSLAVAQAAIESGWGTSRFAQSGNAIFGQRTFDPDRAGFSPKEVQDPNFRVQRFESLMRSIWGYMITLNTHPAHSEFRRLRAQMRRQGNAVDSMALATTLTRYSEERERYVDLVRNVISVNALQRFDSHRLAEAP